MIAAALLLGGCGGDGTEPLVPTDLVKVAGDQQAGDPGETLPIPLEVQVLDQNGDPLADVTVMFQPSSGTVNPGSATTGDDGRASTTYTLPATSGTFTVAATVPGLAPAEFTVFSVAPDCPSALQLEPGESTTVNPLLRTCDVVLPTGGVGDRYRLGVVRAGASANAGDTTFVQVVVSGDALAASLAGPDPVAAPAALDLPEGMIRDLLADPARSRAHLGRLRESVALARRLGPDAWEAAVRRETGGAAGVAGAAAPSRRILDASDQCSVEDERIAHLLGENDHLAIYQDSIQREDLPVSATSVQRMLDYYELYGRQVTDQYFGGTSDLNGDNQIVVFVSPTVSSDFAAFVWSGDFFDQSDCPASNEMEIIYFAAQNIRAMEAPDDQRSFQALSTLVHEAKHVSSLFNRLAATNRTGTDQFHPSWVEEGTAEIAGEMSSRLAWADSGGPAVTAEVTRQHFQNTGFTSANWGVALRLARLVWYLSSQPNAITVTPVGADPNHNLRGGGWHFHRWIGDAWAGAADQALGDADFFRQQNDSLTEAGHRGIENLLGMPFPDLLGLYTEAVATNGMGVEAARPFSLYDFTTAAEIFRDPDPPGVFPWPVTTDDTTGEPSVGFAPATYGAPMGPSGVQIYDFESTGTGSAAEIDVRMRGPALLVVTRLR